MLRTRTIPLLILFALISSACASSVTVGEPARAVAAPLDGAASTEVAAAAALATPVPEQRPTPTPTSATEWVVTGQAAEGTVIQPPPHLSERFAVGICYTVARYEEEVVVPCADLHSAEVVGVDGFTHDASATYPGFAAAVEIADSHCVNLLGNLRVPALSTLSRAVLVPSLPDWNRGDRSFVCLIRFDEQVVASLASMVDGEQSARAQQQAAQLAQAEAARDEAGASGERAESEWVANLQVQVGECTSSDGVTKVSCSQPHGYRAFARTNLASANGVYPGHSLVYEQAEDYCKAQQASAGLVGVIAFISPNQWEWDDFGIRAVTCLLSTEQLPSIDFDDLTSDATFDSDTPQEGE